MQPLIQVVNSSSVGLLAAGAAASGWNSPPHIKPVSSFFAETQSLTPIRDWQEKSPLPRGNLEQDQADGGTNDGTMGEEEEGGED